MEEDSINKTVILNPNSNLIPEFNKESSQNQNLQ